MTNDLTCTAIDNPVTFPANATLTVTVLVTPTAAGSLVNPRTPGVCAADPNNNVSESNETNNGCADTVTVEKRTTATDVTCLPATVAINEGTLCVVTVDDIDTGTKSSPSGTVDFSRSGPGTGTFSSASCTLAPIDGDSSACQVGYRPTSGAGAHVIDADYQGSLVHKISSGSDTVTVHERTTSASLSCATPVSIDEASTCTITLTDTDAGQKSDPSGTVSFSSSNLTGGVFSNPGASCTLVSDGVATFTSSCTVDYTGDTAQIDTISATYDETQLGAPCLGQRHVPDHRREAHDRHRCHCLPATVAINEGTLCVVTVDDIDTGTKSSPSGTVDFSRTGPGTGTFSSASCTLAPTDGDRAPARSATGRPAAPAPTPSTADYQGSLVHKISSGSDTVTVHERTTSASLSCDTPVSIDEASTCTITLTDTDAGQKSDPSGTVSFSSNNRTGGVFSNPGASCTLVSDGVATFTSSCTVDYTGDTAQIDTISATYDETSSALHASTATRSDHRREAHHRHRCRPASRPRSPSTRARLCVVTVDDIDTGTKSSPRGTRRLQPERSGHGHLQLAPPAPWPRPTATQQRLPGRLPADQRRRRPRHRPPTTRAAWSTRSARAVTRSPSTSGRPRPA